MERLEECGVCEAGFVFCVRVVVVVVVLAVHGGMQVRVKKNIAPFSLQDARRKAIQ